MLKPSRYNYELSLEKGLTLFFNFYTLNLLSLNNSEAKLARDILKNPNQAYRQTKYTGMSDVLMKKGFIIEESIHENELLRAARYKACGDQGNLSLTILPSLKCNLRCLYCYQHRNSESLSEEVERALLLFVRTRIRKGGNLTIDWFGGEPLLHLDIIERLSRQFIDFCTALEAGYSASIITNGYLLNKENIEKLAALKVKYVQITLDGPQEIHDRRRPLAGSHPTFAVIMANLKEAVDRFNVNIRMNIDEENKHYIEPMIDILIHEGLEQKAGFYLGRTYPYTEACADISGQCLSDADFSLLGLETLMTLLKHGFAYTYWMPSSKDSVCTADKQNSFVIMPSGAVLNCWNDTATPGKEVGHLLHKMTDKMKENIREWAQCDPFLRADCLACQLLPICMGGCPFLFRVRGKSDCHPWKHNLNESLACYYYLKVVEREKKIERHIWEAAEAVRKMKALTEKRA